MCWRHFNLLGNLFYNLIPLKSKVYCVYFEVISCPSIMIICMAIYNKTIFMLMNLISIYMHDSVNTFCGIRACLCDCLFSGSIIPFKVWRYDWLLPPFHRTTAHTWLCCGTLPSTREFYFSEENIYLFVYIDVVAFKIVLIRYYTLVPVVLPIP